MIASNASPLIALSKIGRLRLLQLLYGEVVIPPEVQREIIRHPDGFGRPRPPWVRIQAVADLSTVAALRQDLDPGEAEAIVLALQLGTGLLIDERAGREAARTKGIRVVGTLGALLDARQRGLLPRLEPVLEQLQSTGFYVTEELIAQVRLAARE